jgi:exopolyphosphatase/guanosine-5'-triphosphate,3'-diphosphate pyrophosphatase
MNVMIASPLSVGVIDVGSNSIKALVLADQGGTFRPLYSSTCETRLGEGMSVQPLILKEEVMLAAAESVKKLWDELIVFNPQAILIAATSAARDAVNKETLKAMIYEKTGQVLTILSGEEEAIGIGHGVLTDPLVAEWPEFYAFDLGGGSLECIHIKNNAIEKAQSLPLGAVRLTGLYVKDFKKPLSTEDQASISHHVNRVLDDNGCLFSVAPMIGTSGAFTISRAILAYRMGRSFVDMPPYLEVPYLSALFREMSQLSLEERLKVPKLPPSRADIFPTALLTVLEVAKRLKADRVWHSQRNLRFGLAYQLLSKLKQTV